MNIDDIIQAINASNVTPSAEASLANEAHRSSCDVAPEVVAALAEHIGAQKPEDLLPLIQRLATEVEKKRLSFVNQKLNSHAAFNEAMAKLHEWRTANKSS